MQPYVSREEADRAVATDDEAARKKGMLVVAMQLDNSAIFSRFFWQLAIIGVGISIWLQSWIPIIVVVLLLVIAFTALIPLAAHRVAKTGMLPEYQAAYKRLYYKDQEFKQQVDAVMQYVKEHKGK